VDADNVCASAGAPAEGARAYVGVGVLARVPHQRVLAAVRPGTLLALKGLALPTKAR